jgi:iron(III) transport system substrate-binding protein
MRLKIIALVALALVAVLAAGCTTPSGGAEDAEGTAESIVVYSSRNEDFVDPLLDKFTEDTGIEVEVLHAGDTMVNRLKEEAGTNVQADVVISNDAGALEHLRIEEVLASVGAIEGIDTIDPAFRAEDDSWVGLSARTRAFIYNKDLIAEEDVPQGLWDLTDSARAGEFAMTRGGNSSMLAHISALRAVWGDEKTEEWISKAKDNAGAITDGHGDIRKAVGAGEFPYGLVNNYYYHQQLLEPTDNNVGIVYPDQGPDGTGAFVNAAGVGFVADGPNPAAAVAFAEWVLLPENQKEFSYNSLEVPLNPDVEAPENAAAIDSYKVLEMPLSELGLVWEDTRDLVEKAGLALELK